MSRWALGICIGLLAIGYAWWLLQDGEESGAPLLVSDEESDAATHAGLRGREPPASLPEFEGPSPYAGVDSPRDLLAHLVDDLTAEAAIKRTKRLVGSDATRIRAFLRLLHPDAGTTNGLWPDCLKRPVSEVLLAAGDAAIDVLIQELDDVSGVYRMNIDSLIGAFGARAGRAVPRLLRQLADVPQNPPGDEAASAVYALAGIGPAAKAVLPDVYRWLEEGVSEPVEIAAAHALVRIGGANDETFSRCRVLLREVSWPKQRAALLIEIGRLRERAQPLLPHLLQIMEEGVLDEDSGLSTLGAMGIPDPRLLEYLTKRWRATPDSEWSCVQYGTTLVRLGEPGLSLLLRLARERDLLAVAKLPFAFQVENPSYKRLLRAMQPALTAQDETVRRTGFAALARLNAFPDELLAPVLMQGLRDESSAVRLICARMSGSVDPLPLSLARTLLGRLQDQQEAVELALTCAGVLSRHREQVTQPLFDAVVALHRRHPSRRDVLLQFHAFVGTHTDAVLSVWATAVAAKTVYWRQFVGSLRDLPASALKPYPGARSAVERVKKLPR